MSRERILYILVFCIVACFLIFEIVFIAISSSKNSKAKPILANPPENKKSPSLLKEVSNFKIPGVLNDQKRFIIEISVGNPPQKMRMLLDTGWKMFWVAANPSLRGTLFKNVFDESINLKSSDKKEWSDGAHGVSSGYCRMERVSMGEHVFEEMEICFGTSFSGSRWNGMREFDGIIGLWPSGIFLSQIPSFLPDLTEKAFCFDFINADDKSVRSYDFIIGNCSPQDKQLNTIKVGSTWNADLMGKSAVVKQHDTNEMKSIPLTSYNFWFDTGAYGVHLSPNDHAALFSYLATLGSSNFHVYFPFGNGNIVLDCVQGPAFNNALVFNTILECSYTLIGSFLLYGRFTKFDWDKMEFSIEKETEGEGEYLIYHFPRA